MVSLSRFQMANVKRTALSVKSLRRKGAKLNEKITSLKTELEEINKIIDEFEAPIISMTGGYTSEQVLDNNFPKEDKVVIDPIELDELETNNIEE